MVVQTSLKRVHAGMEQLQEARKGTYLFEYQALVLNFLPHGL